MRSFSFIVASLVACLAAASQEIREPVPEDFMTIRMSPLRLSVLPPGSSDVTTSAKLAGTLGEDVPLEQQVTLLCGFVNDGREALNVTGIMGSLNAPESFKYYYVNFTYKAIGEIVEPGHEMTFSYPFKLRAEDIMSINPQAQDIPTPVQMAMTVFYVDRAMEFSTTFFNQTVKFIPSPQPVDWEFLVMLVRDSLLAAAVVFGLTYGVIGQAVFDYLPAPVASLLGHGSAAADSSAGSVQESSEATQHAKAPSSAARSKSKSRSK